MPSKMDQNRPSLNDIDRWSRGVAIAYGFVCHTVFAHHGYQYAISHDVFWG